MREGKFFKTVIGGREVTVETGKYAVVNNSTQSRTTVFYDMEGNSRELTLAGNQLFVLSNSNCK